MNDTNDVKPLCEHCHYFKDGFDKNGNYFERCNKQIKGKKIGFDPEPCEHWKEKKTNVIENSENKPITEIIPEVDAIAREIMDTGDPVQFILDTHQTIHKGDLDTALTLLLSLGAQSGLNTGGIQPKISGEAAKGKTHCVRAMTHLVPKTWMLETNVSDKALYYMDMLPGSVIFCDDVKLSEALESILKRSTSNFQNGDTWTTLDKDRVAEEHTIPPRIAFWLTSVDDNDQMQLLTRQFGGSVNESYEQDNTVCEFQLKQASIGAIEYPENAEVLICREIIRDLKESTHIVDIPFAENIIWNDKVNRRNSTIFLDMIRAFAVLRKHQRPTSEDNHVVALIEDYNDAKTLYGGRAELQGTKLTPNEKKVVDLINKLGTIEAADLQIQLKISSGRLSQIMNGVKSKDESGLLYKVKELHKVKESVRTTRYNEDSLNENDENEIITVTKTYYSLNGGVPDGVYDNIVFLKPDTESVLNHALGVLYPCFRCALGINNNNIINNSIHYNGLKDKCTLGILENNKENIFNSLYNSRSLTEKCSKTLSTPPDNERDPKAHLKHAKAHLKHTPDCSAQSDKNTIKIKLTSPKSEYNIDGIKYSIKCGDIADVPQKKAEQLIKLNMAINVS